MHRVQNCFTPRAADPAVSGFLEITGRKRVFRLPKSTSALALSWLGDSPTIVDFSMAGYVYYPALETGFDIAAEYPAIDAWRRRVACAARLEAPI